TPGLILSNLATLLASRSIAARRRDRKSSLLMSGPAFRGCRRARPPRPLTARQPSRQTPPLANTAGGREGSNASAHGREPSPLLLIQRIVETHKPRLDRAHCLAGGGKAHTQCRHAAGWGKRGFGRAGPRESFGRPQRFRDELVKRDALRL